MNGQIIGYIKVKQGVTGHWPRIHTRFHQKRTSMTNPTACTQSGFGMVISAAQIKFVGRCIQSACWKPGFAQMLIIERNRPGIAGIINKTQIDAINRNAALVAIGQNNRRWIGGLFG